MFAPRFAIFAFVFAVAASASVVQRRGGGQECTTGPIQCCDSVQHSDQDAVTTITQALGIALPNVAIPVGLTCTPISILAIGGNSCDAQTVCCENNNFNGLVALGCTPIDISL